MSGPSRRTRLTSGGPVVALCLAAGVLLGAGPPPSARAEGAPANDYPTITRADYVFACMQVNGQSRESLEKCSCSIDVIATILPHEEYEAIETILMVYRRGGKAQQQMGSGQQQQRVKALRQAQVEGELRCF